MGWGLIGGDGFADFRGRRDGWAGTVDIIGFFFFFLNLFFSS